MLGLNLWGRKVVPRKCTPWKTGMVLEPFWNLAGTLLEPFWNLARTLLEPCWNLAWNLAGTLLESFWNLAGTLLEPLWNLAGTLPEPCCNSWLYIGKLLWRIVLVLIVSALFYFLLFLLRFNAFLLCLVCWFFQVMGGQGAHLQMKIFFLELVAGTYFWLEYRTYGALLKPFWNLAGTFSKKPWHPSGTMWELCWTRCRCGSSSSSWMSLAWLSNDFCFSLNGDLEHDMRIYLEVCMENWIFAPGPQYVASGRVPNGGTNSKSVIYIYGSCPSRIW